LEAFWGGRVELIRHWALTVLDDETIEWLLNTCPEI